MAKFNYYEIGTFICEFEQFFLEDVHKVVEFNILNRHCRLSEAYWFFNRLSITHFLYDHMHTKGNLAGILELAEFLFNAGIN